MHCYHVPYAIQIWWQMSFLQRITEKQNKVVITDRMWARLLSSTNQPSFLGPKCVSVGNGGNTDTSTNEPKKVWFFSTSVCISWPRINPVVPHLDVWVMYYNNRLIRSFRNKFQGHISVRITQREALNFLLRYFLFLCFYLLEICDSKLLCIIAVITWYME